MDKEKSILDKEAEDMTAEDWELLASSEDGYIKIAEKIKTFFKLFEVSDLCSNIEELTNYFKKGFEELNYPKPLKSLNLIAKEGYLFFFGYVFSPLDDSEIYFETK